MARLHRARPVAAPIQSTLAPFATVADTVTVKSAGTKAGFNPHSAASAANASGFLLVSLSKTPRPDFHVSAPALYRRGVSDEG